MTPSRTRCNAVSQRPRVLLADRGDPVAGPLSAELGKWFDVVGSLDVELNHSERLLVAGTTFRVGRRAWAERFYKSNLAVELRSRRARRGLARDGRRAHVVLQTHALFRTGDPRTVMYVDSTHRQSMRHWDPWNPLRGRALRRWLSREHDQYHQAAHVFAFHERAAASLIDEYDVPAHRVSVVGAGVNFDELPATRPRQPAVPVVLFVGNDFERKGGPLLLQAFALVRQSVPEARLLLVGTPYPIEAQDGVEHLGRVADRDRLSRLYAGASVFVLPSHFDPYPGVLLEAMAHGVPSVATPVCGVPEIVVDGVTGLIVADEGAGFVPALAAALERLLTDHDLAAEMGRAARVRVEERFLWSHVVQRMAPVLERLSEKSDEAVRSEPDRPTHEEKP